FLTCAFLPTPDKEILLNHRYIIINGAVQLFRCLEQITIIRVVHSFFSTSLKARNGWWPICFRGKGQRRSRSGWNTHYLEGRMVFTFDRLLFIHPLGLFD